MADAGLVDELNGGDCTATLQGPVATAQEMHFLEETRCAMGSSTSHQAPPLHAKLEAGASGAANERGTMEVRRRAYVHTGKATEWVSQVLHGSYLVAPASRRSFTMAE